MRHITLPLSAVAIGCALLQPRFEAVDPEYGYVDGCTDIILQGAAIGSDATVTIGGVPLLSIRSAEYDDDLPEHAQDVGFKYFGRTAAAPDMAPGFYDVVMTVPDEKSGEPVIRSLNKGFYYLVCPASVHFDYIGLPAGEADSADTGAPPPAPVAAGTSIPLVGCGMDPATVRAELRAPDGSVLRTMPLTSDCLTARTSFTIPADTPSGDWYFVLVHDDGTVAGLSCSTAADTAGETASETDADTDVPSDTDATCTYTTTITVDGAP